MFTSIASVFLYPKLQMSLSFYLSSTTEEAHMQLTMLCCHLQERHGTQRARSAQQTEMIEHFSTLCNNFNYRAEQAQVQGMARVPQAHPHLGFIIFSIAV